MSCFQFASLTARQPLDNLVIGAMDDGKKVRIGRLRVAATQADDLVILTHAPRSFVSRARLRELALKSPRNRVSFHAGARERMKALRPDSRDVLVL
jgi:hypothetical protein